MHIMPLSDIHVYTYMFELYHISIHYWSIICHYCVCSFEL